MCAFVYSCILCQIASVLTGVATVCQPGRPERLLVLMFCSLRCSDDTFVGILGVAGEEGAEAEERRAA